LKEYEVFVYIPKFIEVEIPVEMTRLKRVHPKAKEEAEQISLSVSSPERSNNSSGTGNKSSIENIINEFSRKYEREYTERTEKEEMEGKKEVYTYRIS
jgi:flagellar motor switch protein FliG